MLSSKSNPEKLIRRSAAEQEKLHADLTDLWERRITFNQILGFKVQSLDPNDARVFFEMRPELVGHMSYGRLHGGVISSILDAAGGYAVMLAMGEKYSDESSDQVMHRFLKMGTIDLRIDYLSQGIGKSFVARATVSRLGGRIASTQMALHNDAGKLIATGAAAYIIS